MPACAMGAAAGGSALAGLGGSFMQSNAAIEAAQMQQQAAEYSANLMFQEFGINQANLKPFITGGQQAMGGLNSLLGIGPGGKGFLNSYLGKPFSPTMAQLSATPGYQFALSQGEQAVQNQAASQGLGKSGAEMKGAGTFAEGLASTTYQQQFQNNLAQKQMAYNMLSGQANLGENAAAQSGALGVSGMNSITNLLTGGAAAGAAGIMGSANAWAQGLYGLGGAGNNAAMMYMMSQNGMFSPQGGAAPGMDYYSQIENNMNYDNYYGGGGSGGGW